MSTKKSTENKVMDDTTDDTIQCIECKCEIKGKPWTIVHFPEDDYTVYACRYLCSTNLKYHVGPGYWNNVVNKEDFPGPRPILKHHIKKDITTNFGIETIKEDIINEEKRIQMIEDEYEYESDFEMDEYLYN